MEASEETKACVEAMAFIGKSLHSLNQYNYERTLGWKDQEIAELRAENEALREELAAIQSRILGLVFGPGRRAYQI